MERLLRTLGITHAHVDDLAPAYDPALAVKRQYVFVYNDDVSRMDDVVRWLQRSFAIDRGRAALVMVGIHKHGLGVLGPFEPDQTLRHLEQARVVAHELGLTELRFSATPPR